tara:strand:- start:557 stop:949 length:393 start_codon:yes stop_codon:yes gene_type:complete
MNKKYENSGNLFPAANTEVVRKGTVDIDGTEAEMVITRTRTKDGKSIYEAWFKAGGLFVNNEVTEKRGFNMSGEILHIFDKMMCWCYKRMDKNSNPYTRVSFAPAKPKENKPEINQIENKSDDFDDDIPF